MYNIKHSSFLSVWQSENENWVRRAAPRRAARFEAAAFVMLTLNVWRDVINDEKIMSAYTIVAIVGALSAKRRAGSLIPFICF